MVDEMAGIVGGWDEGNFVCSSESESATSPVSEGGVKTRDSRPAACGRRGFDADADDGRTADVCRVPSLLTVYVDVFADVCTYACMFNSGEFELLPSAS